MSAVGDGKWGRIFAIAVTLVFGVLFALTHHLRERNRQTMTRTQVRQARASLIFYIREYGASPGGDNARILASLKGDNPRKIVFFETSAQFLNPKGELIDAWGTPLHFDNREGIEQRVWSNGRNRQDDNGAEGSDDITSWR